LTPHALERRSGPQTLNGSVLPSCTGELALTGPTARAGDTTFKR